MSKLLKVAVANFSHQLLKPRIVNPCAQGGVRFIKNHVRGKILDLQGRRKLEQAKYPRPPTPRSGYLEWNYDAELFAFGKRLNENFDDSLLRQAFIDKSFVIAEMKRQEEVGLDSSSVEMKDNAFMALEGMIILRNTIQSYLTRELPLIPKEGVESICDFLTSEPVLAHISSHIGTKDIILTSEYPPSEATLSNTFQAIVSALDKSSGRPSSEKFVVDFVATHLSGKDVNDIWDIPKPWTMLTKLMAEKDEKCEPRLIRESGRNSVTSVFMIGVYTTNKELIGTGIGETLEIAQEMAARDALKGIFGTRETRRTFKFA